MRSYKKLILTAGASLALLLLAQPAFAANPHFIGTPTATQSGSTLTVKFKAAGLGNVPTADFTVTGEAVVFSRCYTKSNNKPQAANKQETAALSTSGSFPVRNGQTTGTLTLTAPAPTLVCPRGQRVVTESVSFQNVMLSGMGLTHSF
ncbi:MAG: hypothetical protein ACRDLB_15670 [Actinomycetota bacterium]